MHHHQSCRIIFKDGLQVSGAYNEERSNSFKIALLGHQHAFFKRNIHDMFIKIENIWTREIGISSLYDEYIKQGGQEWPKIFFDVIYSDDL
tara:strand:- start:3010 stop:3282 length:273 start_codon:yes stop_codon:yes gene_type:complete